MTRNLAVIEVLVLRVSIYKATDQNDNIVLLKQINSEFTFLCKQNTERLSGFFLASCCVTLLSKHCNCDKNTVFF